MPIRSSLAHLPSPNEEDLRRELLGELQAPKNAGEPDVIVETKGGGVHLFVVWSKWTGLEQAIRSRVILDAYEEWKGEQDALRVTVSMGLTPDEARTMGIA
jgi:hypothetical protein